MRNNYDLVTSVIIIKETDEACIARTFVANKIQVLYFNHC